MTQTKPYPIGTAGKKWGDAEKSQWLAQQQVKRSYQQLVVSQIQALSNDYDVEQYGALPIDSERYPLFAIKSNSFDLDKPTILITGGVHGYETSGVMGALRFMQTKAAHYEDQFNIIVAPCVSPWGFETINRWNNDAIDPNRSFYLDSPAAESAQLLDYIAAVNLPIFAHFDLHETTDTDNSEFRPALSARDAIVQKTWNIPDGFYLVGDSENPQHDFQKAMISGVEKVTHIAPADDNQELIGEPITQFGVINYDTKKLGLCAGLSSAQFVTTTEVYPDSPKVDDENCILAQVAAVTAGLDYLLEHIL
jgi:hypothetical protein